MIDRGRGEPVDRIAFVVEYYRTHFGNLTVKHLHDAPRAEHGFEPSCRWVKAVLQSRGLGEVIEAKSYSSADTGWQPPR
jgi:hypothetical protein